EPGNSVTAKPTAEGSNTKAQPKQSLSSTDGSQAKVKPDKSVTSKSTVADTKVQSLITEASQAQSAGELKRAASLWGELLDEDVDAIVRCRAHFSAGLCHSQLRDFEPSIAHFKKGLEVATPESAADVPQALFYLGYGQLELGRMLQAASIASGSGEDTAEQKQRADELLTTSSQTLGRLQRHFPDFAGLDQAAFFQGKAFELLGRLEEAAESYRKVLAADQATFTADARFGLADTLAKLGQPSDALEQYRLLIADADQLTLQQKPLLVESEFRAAEVLMSLGDASRESGDDKVAEKDFASAFNLYSSVVDQKNSLPETSQLVPLALYGAAWSKLNSAVGQNKVVAAQAADQWFTRLIDGWPDHELITDATAGRDSARQLVDLLAAQPDDSPKADGGSMSDPVGESSDVERPSDALASAGADDADEKARFKLGLARVEQAHWNDAIEVFGQLIADFPDSRDVDRYRYELAWALRSATPAETKRALEQFAAIAETTPNSSFAAEAHFHLGSADYDRGQYEAATKHFVAALNSDLPPKVLERASYQLGWSDYRLEKFEKAADQFRRQLDAFPDGPMATDAKVMFAESQFRQDKHAAALAAYRVAKPAVDADGNIDPKMQVLTALHGAQSANESQEFEEAIRFAEPVTGANNIPEAYQADAWLEIGIAQAGQGKQAMAIESWQKAVASMSVTGAKARSLIGDALANEDQYREALNQFKLVYFGFGGVDADAEIRPWQAYALYEAARLNQSLCRDASGPALRQRIDEAIGQYQLLLKNYSDSDLAEEAERQLAKLKQLAVR
ncbi:tetratricopeptide repeat protein, partial [Mariniblastus sp.]|nr:tetratricopeptide repeat protein [Mariniblastus sp.]